MPTHTFQLVGGDPALDFVNTIHDWTVSEPRDYLPGFEDALRFGVVTGVLSRREVKGVATRGGAELQRLHELRARLERIFRAVVTSSAPAAADLDHLARDGATAAAAARLRPARGRIGRQVEPKVAGDALLRLRLAEAAIALLSSGRVERLKTCPGCGWFFLDTSKNRSRRWCSMAMCGSVVKARRYYWRTARRRRRAAR